MTAGSKSGVGKKLTHNRFRFTNTKEKEKKMRFEYYLIIGAVVALVIWRRNDFARIMTALGAQIGKLASLIWSADPIAVYQAEVDKAAADIGEATTGLEEYRGNVASMERAVAKGEKDEATLLARVKVAINNKDENRTADHALHLKQVQDKLKTDREKLANHKEAYQNNLKKIEYARKTIDDRRRKAADLKAELRMSKVDAQLAQTSMKLNVKMTSFDKLAEIEGEIERQIDQNKGTEQVALDLSREGLEEIKEQEDIQRAEAAELVAKLKAEMGVGVAPNPPATATK
jgi:phage shock protein A